MNSLRGVWINGNEIRNPLPESFGIELQSVEELNFGDSQVMYLPSDINIKMKKLRTVR